MWNGKFEFGGPIGAVGLIAFSHFILYYFYVCIEFYGGSVVYPGHPALLGEPFAVAFWRHIGATAAPTWWTFSLFSAFYAVHYILALSMPGPVTFGLPIPSENGHRFIYRCNAVYAWYAILAMVGALHYTEVFPLWTIRENYGRFMTAAVIWGDLVSLVCYVQGLSRPIRMSGNIIYDFFMGSALNYRLPGNIDLKLFAEIRNSWILLFLLTCSCAAKMYKDTGYITGNMWFLIVAHFLYVNACQKGEECIPTTWDIFHEKFGWMLCFWNFAGVPFLYSVQALYLQRVLPTFEYSKPTLVCLFIVLFAAYHIWDNVNSQKNRFRMKREGVPEEIIQRRTFPRLAWGYIENPRTVKSDRGELFVDGWYRFGRKIHYTVDIVMSFLWGLSCGLGGFIPYFYFIFFTLMLMHRNRRDEDKCKSKYGPLWEEYCKAVPYKFIPGIY